MIAALSAFFFFFNDTATTEIYTLSLHDALPISMAKTTLIHVTATDNELYLIATKDGRQSAEIVHLSSGFNNPVEYRSEEHTSELQSLAYLVCRLLLEKKKKTYVHSTAILIHVTL